MTKSRRLAYLALIGNMVLWALAIPIAKRGFADGLTPTTFLLGRYLLAIPLSLPIIFSLYKKSSVRAAFVPKTLLKIILLELLGTVIALLLLYEGVNRTTAVEASLIAITWPIFVTIGGVLWLKEKEEFHELLGLILAIAGTTILVVKPLVNGTSLSGNLVGNLLIVGQNISIAIYYLSAKKIYAPLNKWAVTHLSFWVGLGGFASLEIFQGGNPISSLDKVVANPSPWPLLAIVYMAIGGSILGLTLYLIGQDKIEASEAAVFTYLEPVISIPAAMFLLRESIGPLEILGAAIIALGVYLVSIRPKKRKTIAQ
ncbi:MAG: DMT family transporter [Candidatus Chisholmbacteria bacterium]|nr:DMT family transporter [Candidatus Chisholmbacteria bacterium]